MRAYLSFPSLVVLVLFGLASRPAHAQSTCSADTDCVKGWTCQVTGGSACTSPACAPGEKCEAQPSDCVNEVYKSCRPGACRADSDCADGMVCYTHTETNCPPTACAAGQQCPAPSCAPTTESACVPRYLLPCTTASDCGTGFKCESAGDQCACSGSSGGSGDSNDGGTPPPTPQETCTCEPSKELSCTATPVNCAANSDCAAGWTCAVVGSSGGCGKAPAPAPDPAPGAGGQGGATPVPTPPDCTGLVEVKQCVPPYYSLVQGIKGVDRGSSGSADSPTSAVGSGDANDEAPSTPTAESGNTSGTASGTANDTSSDTSSAGCSVVRGTGSGSTLVLFGALGLFSALRRRRAR